MSGVAPSQYCIIASCLRSFSIRQRVELDLRVQGVYIMGRCVVPIAGQHAHAVNIELLVHVQPIPIGDISANLLNFIPPVAVLAKSGLQ